jgi:hypothetical protein
VAEGVPWSCGMPSHNGDVTRVIMMSILPNEGLRVESRLELPGQGSVGVCRPAGGESLTLMSCAFVDSIRNHFASLDRLIVDFIHHHPTLKHDFEPTCETVHAGFQDTNPSSVLRRSQPSLDTDCQNCRRRTTLAPKASVFYFSPRCPSPYTV